MSSLDRARNRAGRQGAPAPGIAALVDWWTLAWNAHDTHAAETTRGAAADAREPPDHSSQGPSSPTSSARRDALWLIEQVRRHQETPFIAISGQDYDEHELVRAGFVAYIRKPVEPDILTNRILRAIAR